MSEKRKPQLCKCVDPDCIGMMAQSGLSWLCTACGIKCDDRHGRPVINEELAKRIRCPFPAYVLLLTLLCLTACSAAPSGVVA